MINIEKISQLAEILSTQAYKVMLSPALEAKLVQCHMDLPSVKGELGRRGGMLADTGSLIQALPHRPKCCMLDLG